MKINTARIIHFLLVILPVVHCSANETTNLECGVGISYTASECVPIGSNAAWSVVLTNSSTTTWTCVVGVNVDAVGYNGDFWGNLASTQVTNVLVSGATSEVNLAVSSGTYAAWPRSSFEVLASVAVQETNQVWISSTRSGVTTPTNVLSLFPEPPITVGGCVTAQVSYLNPFSIDLHDVVVFITADEFLSSSSTLLEYEFSLGTIGTNQYINVTTNFTAEAPGTGTMWVTISGSNLTEISTSTQVPIVE